MHTYKVTSTPNEDHDGVQVWIERNDGESISLACAQGEGEFDDGTSIPNAVLRMAEKYADTVDY